MATKLKNNNTGKIWDQSDNWFKSYGQKNSKYAVQEFGQHLAPNLNHSSSVDTGLGGAALFVLCEILCLIERKGCEILYLFMLQNE